MNLISIALMNMYTVHAGTYRHAHVYMYIFYTYMHILKDKIKYFKKEKCNTEKSSFSQRIFIFVIILLCFSLLKTN